MRENRRRGQRPVLDSGLQAERTRLAWSRTALDFAAVGALLLHTGMSTGHRLQELRGLLGLCYAAVTYLLGVRRYHATPRNVAREQSVTSAGSVRALAALTTLTAIYALVLITT